MRMSDWDTTPRFILQETVRTSFSLVESNGAAEKIRATTKGSVDVEIVDLGSFTSVKNFLRSFYKKYEETGLDILVLNAGFVSTGLYLTEDGIESQWQVNHVSQMFIFEELRDALVLAASERGHATVTAVAKCTLSREDDSFLAFRYQQQRERLRSV